MKSALSSTKWNRTAWAFAVAMTLVLLLGAVLPPFVGAGAAEVLRAGFYTLCHQLPGRSFSVGGVPLAVCHRCTGIFAGLLLGTLLLPALRCRARGWARYDRWVLLVAVLPVVFDWGGNVLGLWANTVGTRVATGLWFGAIAGFIFARSLSMGSTSPRAEPGGNTAGPVGAT